MEKNEIKRNNQQKVIQENFPAPTLVGGRYLTGVPYFVLPVCRSISCNQ
jgi:hypothetical protein